MELTLTLAKPYHKPYQPVYLYHCLLPPPRKWCNRHRLSVCLSISNFAQILVNGFAWNFQGRLAVSQWTNDWILVAIWIMDPDTDPYRDTGKTCLGRGMHCPGASSLYMWMIDCWSIHITINFMYRLSLWQCYKMTLYYALLYAFCLSAADRQANINKWSK